MDMTGKIKDVRLKQDIVANKFLLDRYTLPLKIPKFNFYRHELIYLLNQIPRITPEELEEAGRTLAVERECLLAGKN